MSAFGRAMRDRREQQGWSQRVLAGRAFLNPGYVARLERGERNPSPEVAEVLDRVLDAGGQLAGLVNPPRREPVPPTLSAGDIEGLHGQIAALVSADIAHGADGLWRRAGREFKRAHEALAAGRFPTSHRADLHATVGELGEVAGWLAYDAGRPEVGRRLMTDALLVSQLAGDRAMEGLQLNLLALLAQESGRFAEALALADRGLALAPQGGRVEAMHRLRRGRALASLGSAEGLSELARARALLDAGGRAGEPAWVWWVSPQEVALHQGQGFAALGEFGRAVEWSGVAVDMLPASQRRDRAVYLSRHAGHLLGVRDWPSVESVAGELVPLLSAAGSGRVRGEVAGVVGVARRVGAPGRVVDALTAAAA